MILATIQKWIKASNKLESSDETFQDMKAMQKEFGRLKEENEILKKALAHFGGENSEE